VKVVWLTRARVERQKAIDYIARDSPQAALDQLDEIERQTDMLLDFPNIGRAGRRHGTRELVIAGTPFLAVYRIRAKTGDVQILRLLHGAQRWLPRKRSGH
jgi:toxin ParE1/3/4